jgi:hypothetical protein
MLEILDSVQLPILFHMLDHISTRDISAYIEIHADWERFQGLATEFIAPRTQIRTSEDAEEAAHKFAASIALAYRLSKHNIALWEIMYSCPC